MATSSLSYVRLWSAWLSLKDPNAVCQTGPRSRTTPMLWKPMIRSRSQFGNVLPMAPDNNATPELDLEPPQVSPRDLALLEAKKLRAQAEQQRLEADRMSTVLTLEKIQNLEKKAQIIKKTELARDDSKPNRASREQEEEIRSQIEMLKRQLEPLTKEEPKKERPKGVSSYMTAGGPPSFADLANTAPTPPKKTATKTQTSLSDMELNERIDAFKNFSKDVKELFARAAGASDTSDPEAILVKVHRIEQERKIAMEEDPNLVIPMDVLDVANAQAGYSTLPPPIRSMIADTVDLQDCRNQTEIIVKLLDTNMVKRAEDGGVEFLMGDDDDILEDDKAILSMFHIEPC